VTQSETAGLQPGQKQSAAQPSELNRVLIAEDDPIFRHVLQRWLQSWDYQVVATENGLTAWNVLSQADAPRMAILDWMMPELDGIELCRRIRKKEAGNYHYVLLLTARDNKKDILTGFEAGADDYLTKPFDSAELRARVRAGRRILELQAALMTSQRELQIEATHDRLTGIYNRGVLLDRLESELQRRHRKGEPLGVIIADIDHFKQVNDTYGHLVGDTVLRETARRLASAVRTYDAVGRYGGEEFVVVVPECNRFDLIVLAERLRQAVTSCTVETCAGPLSVTISLGLACVESGRIAHSGCEEILRDADSALYAAKSNGRNRVEIAPQEWMTTRTHAVSRQH
jgi:two-component system cell cycle response regulator